MNQEKEIVRARAKVKVIAARVSENFFNLVENFVAKDTYLNVAEFVRDAMREKIQREASELYSQMFKEDEKDE